MRILDRSQESLTCTWRGRALDDEQDVGVALVGSGDDGAALCDTEDDDPKTLKRTEEPEEPVVEVDEPLVEIEDEDRAWLFINQPVTVMWRLACGRRYVKSLDGAAADEGAHRKRDSGNVV
jgi:hypothetical protein